MSVLQETLLNMPVMNLSRWYFQQLVMTDQASGLHLEGCG